MRKVSISDLIGNDFEIVGDAGREISGIAYDSRNVKGDELFVALKGEKCDGVNFIEDAINNGAAAVMCGKDSLLSDARLLILESKYPGTVWIRAADTREALA